MANKISVAVLALLALGGCATKPVKTVETPPPAAANVTPPPSSNAVDTTPLPDNNANAAADAARAQAVSISLVTQGLKTSGDRIYFDLDSSSITPAAQQILTAQAQLLKANPTVHVLIDGNCDERGTREYNLALGDKRANAAKNFLVALGVNIGQIDTISYGKERPIDERPNPDGWAINRNAHTAVQPQQ